LEEEEEEDFDEDMFIEQFAPKFKNVQRPSKVPKKEQNRY